MVAALDETFRIAREAHIPAEIWHLKVAGKKNWGHMPEMIKRIEAARASGLDITADTYAYTAWFNDMSAFVPPWAHDGGNEKMVERLKDPATRARIVKDIDTPSAAWDNEWDEVPGPESILIGVVKNPALRSLAGPDHRGHREVPGQGSARNPARYPGRGQWVHGLRRVRHAGRRCGAGAGAALGLRSTTTARVPRPEGMLGEEHPHPRAYGTFPRILRKYVREEHRLSLEEAIRKFTALPAQRMRLTDRGVLKRGLWADVVVFDPATVADRSTFSSPNELAVGMRWVLVNGVPVIADGQDDRRQARAGVARPGIHAGGAAVDGAACAGRCCAALNGVARKASERSYSAAGCRCAVASPPSGRVFR